MDLSECGHVNYHPIYKSRNFIYGFEERSFLEQKEIYKSRNFIYGFEFRTPANRIVSTKVEILYMDLRPMG